MTHPFDIPASWAWTTLGEIADVVGGVTKDAKRQEDPSFVEVPYLRVANVQRGYLDLSNVLSIRVPPQKAVALKLSRGDVLLNEGGDRNKLGRGWVWDEQIEDCIHQNHVFRARIRQRVLEPRLLAHFANGIGQRWFEQNGLQSVNLASISLATMKRFPVPVPPLGEQGRIIAALEERLSRLASAESSVRSALRRLSVLRAAAVTQLVDASDAPLRGLISLLDGKMINGKSVPTQPGGFPVLRLTALQDGLVDLGQSKEGAWDAAAAAPYLVRRGDFLVGRGNGSIHLVGRGALVASDPYPVAFPDTMIRVRTDSTKIRQEYLAIIWNSRYVRRQIESKVRTTAGIYKINQSLLGEIQIPVPQLGEQDEIVSRWRSTASAIDRLSGSVRVAARRASSLRSSVLTQAFVGRLVPQDPEDEPASELLARIQAERATAAPKQKARATRTRKELAAPPTRVTGDNYQQEALPL
ncbi:restriction endonuclease subunit S [Micromonospora tulbaghiae]|uniref:Restriction endonuclease S subunit n=1 Tax=Micromonospora tulbaghiae TaxID=479978 RepID=A0ABY0KLQ3_9ACTN|nr:restriction endonuclease subunit S [Micromonospora tulbaghiae]MDX5457843.1 restriction endonuclease subunit S [Micromonospora tulbaghiae]SCE87972.1 Restriction endonuclease S subunit [Micromonospora tulbaghiae]